MDRFLSVFTSGRSSFVNRFTADVPFMSSNRFRSSPTPRFHFVQSFRVYKSTKRRYQSHSSHNDASKRRSEPPLRSCFIFEPSLREHDHFDVCFKTLCHRRRIQMDAARSSSRRLSIDFPCFPFKLYRPLSRSPSRSQNLKCYAARS